MTTGASFTAVTVNVAPSSAYRLSGSVARKVIVSEPDHSEFTTAIVATRFNIVTVSKELAEVVQVISASVSSTSLT